MKITKKQLEKFIVETLNEKKYFFYPATMGNFQSLLVWELKQISQNHYTTSAIIGGKTLGDLYDFNIKKYINPKKYGIPTKKDIKTQLFLDRMMWDEFAYNSKNVQKIYKEFGWLGFSYNKRAKISWAYVGNKKYEILCDYPREIRHPDEYNIKDEYLNEFNKIDEALDKVVKKLNMLGFKVEINSTIDGYK